MNELVLLITGRIFIWNGNNEEREIEPRILIPIYGASLL